MNARNNIGNTPVHSAVQNNQIACLTTLLDHGADLNAEGSFKFRVTHFVTRDCFPDMLRYVLQRGADPNVATLSGDTPGHFAARNRDMFCLRALHNAGATLRGQNSKYFSREYLVHIKRRSGRPTGYVRPCHTLALYPTGVFLRHLNH